MITIKDLKDQIDQCINTFTKNIQPNNIKEFRAIIIDIIDRTLNECYKDLKNNNDKKAVTKKLTVSFYDVCVECSMVYVKPLDKITYINIKLITNQYEYKG